MDIIITAPANGGKTRAARMLAAQFLHAESWDAAKSKVLVISDPYNISDDPYRLACLLAPEKKEVVIFDESLVDSGDLRRAIEGIRRYRVLWPDRSLLAIYCHQASDAISLFST